MPVYDYACTACGRTIEVMHGVHAHGPATCEICGGQMRKLLSAPAIVFKGSGWAKKDARAASRPKTSKASSGAGDSAGGSDAGTKPAGSGGTSSGGGSSGGTSSGGASGGSSAE